MLMASRRRVGPPGAEEEGCWTLADLPRELLNHILVFVGSGRLPPKPPGPGWEMIGEEGDDGLPIDWRACLPSLAHHPGNPKNEEHG
jgi:hypothetical protein